MIRHTPFQIDVPDAPIGRTPGEKGFDPATSHSHPDRSDGLLTHSHPAGLGDHHMPATGIHRHVGEGLSFNLGEKGDVPGHEFHGNQYGGGGGPGRTELGNSRFHAPYGTGGSGALASHAALKNALGHLTNTAQILSGRKPTPHALANALKGLNQAASAAKDEFTSHSELHDHIAQAQDKVRSAINNPAMARQYASAAEDHLDNAIAVTENRTPLAGSNIQIHTSNNLPGGPTH